MCVEDDEGEFPAEVMMRKKVRSLIGTWHDIHDKPITFDARRFHQLESRTPRRSYVGLGGIHPRAFKHIPDGLGLRVSGFGFRVQGLGGLDRGSSLSEGLFLGPPDLAAPLMKGS